MDFLKVQNNVKLLFDFLESSNGTAVNTLCEFSQKEHDEIAKSVLKSSPEHGKRVAELSTSEIYESHNSTSQCTAYNAAENPAL